MNCKKENTELENVQLAGSISPSQTRFFSKHVVLKPEWPFLKHFSARKPFFGASQISPFE